MLTDDAPKHPLTVSRNRQSAASTSSQCSVTFTFGQTSDLSKSAVLT